MKDNYVDAYRWHHVLIRLTNGWIRCDVNDAEFAEEYEEKKNGRFRLIFRGVEIDRFHDVAFISFESITEIITWYRDETKRDFLGRPSLTEKVLWKKGDAE